jgi:hypothetical protein
LCDQAYSGELQANVKGTYLFDAVGITSGYTGLPFWFIKTLALVKKLYKKLNTH